MSYFSTLVEQSKKRIEMSPSPVLFCLDGPLGAGKTTFVKELLSSWGVPENDVQSPSFLKLLEYDVDGFGLVLHLDCYRMESEAELVDLGIEHYCDRARLFCVEWPELFLGFCQKRGIAFGETVEIPFKSFAR